MRWQTIVFLTISLLASLLTTSSSAFAIEISGRMIVGAIGLVVAIAESPLTIPIGLGLGGTIGVLFTGRYIYRRSTAADLYRVWFGTNRKVGLISSFRFIAPILSDEITYGICTVSIPKTHKFGSIGSGRVKRWLKRFTSGTDDRLRLVSAENCAVGSFIQSLKSELKKQKPNQRCVLVYIHGFNVDFQEAAIRAAQIGFDLKVPGAMAFFSWPSQGKVHGYPADEDMIAASEDQIAEFLVNVARVTNSHKVHVLAHSMGNRGFLRALSGAKYQAELQGVRFGQIFLAAPDMDAALFHRLAKRFSGLSERTTLYVSGGDKALEASASIHQNARVGYSPPVTILEGIDTIEVTNLDIGFLGHGYFSEAAAVLYDMSSLLRNDAPPQDRPSLYSSETTEGKLYWVIRSQANP